MSKTRKPANHFRLPFKSIIKVMSTKINQPEELTNYEQFQLERYGDILPSIEVMPDGACENGIDDLRRFETWYELQSQLSMYEYEH